MGAANVVVGFADGSALMGVGMLKLLRQVLTMMLVSLGSGGGESGGGGVAPDRGMYLVFPASGR
jgi:hypothetical protein